MSEILIFGLVLACIGSGVNRVNVEFGADNNNELSCRKQDISVGVAVDPVLHFRNLDSRSAYGYVVCVANPLAGSVGRGISAR